MNNRQDLQRQNMWLSAVSMGLVLALVFGEGFFTGASSWVFLVAVAVGAIGCVTRIVANAHAAGR